MLVSHTTVFTVKNLLFSYEKIIFSQNSKRSDVMNFKKFGLAVLAASVFTFIACDDSASASGDETKGETQQITSSESNDGGDKTAASSSSEESVNNSESKNNAGSGTTDENPGTETNSGSKTTEPDSESQAASSSSDEGGVVVPDTSFNYMDYLKCDEEGATQEMMGGITQTCKNGQWTVDSASVVNFMSCDEEGATQSMMGMATMVCKNGQWEYDSTATAAANKCDVEGATKTETMMGTMEMTYVCKDGQWTIDMSSFGSMFGGDSTGFNFGDSSFTMPGGGIGGDIDWSQFGSEIPAETPGLK